MIIRIFFVIQLILARVFRLLGLFLSRSKFESENSTDEMSKPWQDKSPIWAFHCSSEGEFEQLKPLMQRQISDHQPIEIIFTSPSVSRKVRDFATSNKDMVRYLRLPILHPGYLSGWSKAQSLIMCRYDFFPELLLMPVKTRILVWASLKGKNSNFWLKAIYAQFNFIIASTTDQFNEIQKIISTQTRMEVYDFRPFQIRQRLLETKLSKDLIELVKVVEPAKRLIVGSAWQNDLHLFSNILQSNHAIHLWLAPHDLSKNSLSSFQSFFNDNYPSLKLVSINLNNLATEISKFKEIARENLKVIWLLESPGVLVELYSHFEYAYVGGGFGRSIHSVLEPAIAGCKISCGLKTHRSTEIDLVDELSPKQIQVVSNASDFDQWWSDAHQQSNPLDDDKVCQAIENWINKSDEIIGKTLAH